MNKNTMLLSKNTLNIILNKIIRRTFNEQKLTTVVTFLFLFVPQINFEKNIFFQPIWSIKHES